MSLIVKLPFPAPEMMPNRKNGKHWTATLKVKNAQKTEAAICTKNALSVAGHQNFGAGNVALSLLYLTPDKRHRDLDNLLAASKHILDSLAKELGIDDKQFKPVLIDCVLGPKDGALIAAVGVTIQSSVQIKQAISNRPTNFPGGCECQQCGAIFIGRPAHNVCGICA